jgi:hypothetical protein
MQNQETDSPKPLETVSMVVSMLAITALMVYAFIKIMFL